MPLTVSGRKEGAGPDRKPSSVPYGRCRPGGGGHSSGTAVACRLKRRYPRTSDGPSSSVLLFGLAPDGVYQAFPVTRETGELLPRLFTLTCNAGGIFSVALSLGLPPVAVSDHPALWSSDFPPFPQGNGDHLICSGTFSKIPSCSASTCGISLFRKISHQEGGIKSPDCSCHDSRCSGRPSRGSGCNWDRTGSLPLSVSRCRVGEGDSSGIPGRLPSRRR